MKKGIIFFGLVVLGIVISSFKINKDIVDYNLESLYYSVPLENEYTSNSVNIPFTGNKFNGFREALAFKESQGRYTVVNSLGYMGKYQFGRTTLERFKIKNTHQFLNSPELQEEAFIALCSVNKWILRKDIARSVGKTINGVKISESGILAAAHLAGAGNVKKYLRSGGNFDFKDAYGSSIQYYLKRFYGYDTSFIEANQKATV